MSRTVRRSSVQQQAAGPATATIIRYVATASRIMRPSKETESPAFTHPR